MTTRTEELQGHVAIVTGASRGLGCAFARALAEAGATVALVARTSSDLERVAGEIEAAGGRARAVTADVTDADAAREIVARVEREIGSVDLLVNAAGLGTPFGPFHDDSIEEWWRTLEVNLRGPAVWCRAVLPGMIARRSGRIINVASGAGTVAIPYLSAYVTSKTALIRLTEVVAAEVAEHGVTVLAIEPGTVRTAMAEKALTSETGRRWMPWFARIFEEGRDVTAEQSAAFLMRLATGAADTLSGRILMIRDDLDALRARVDLNRKDGTGVLRVARP